jgi:hypothetical protein
MTTPEDTLKEFRLWDVVLIGNAPTFVHINIVSAMRAHAAIHHKEQLQIIYNKQPRGIIGNVLRLFGIIKEIKLDCTCKGTMGAQRVGDAYICRTCYKPMIQDEI